MKSSHDWIEENGLHNCHELIMEIQADAIRHAADYLASRGSTFTWDDAIAHLRSEADRLAAKVHRPAKAGA